MQREEIDIEALKKNEEFLANLETLEQEMKSEKSIRKGYQLLDALLLVSEDEEKINDVFTFVLQEAFDRLAEYLSQQRGFDLSKEEELFAARAIYEHAIERYSENDRKGAKELFQVLHYMIDDEPLQDAMMVHAISVMQGKDFDTFIEKVADTDRIDMNDPQAYFLKHFKMDVAQFLDENRDLMKQAKEELKVLEEK